MGKCDLNDWSSSRYRACGTSRDKPVQRTRPNKKKKTATSRLGHRMGEGGCELGKPRDTTRARFVSG